MKSINKFILIAIGMMVFTATANTTAKSEQKQKTELVKDYTFLSNEVNVVNETKVITVVSDAKNESIKSQDLKFVNEPKTSFTIIKDVGWQGSLINSNQNIFCLIHKANISTKRKNC